MEHLGLLDHLNLCFDFRTRYNAGIFLLLRSYLNIPHGHSKVHGDVNCIVPNKIHPFAFRTHAHQWGTVIRGYKYTTQSQEFEEIAAGNPQWPQQFYPIKKEVTVNHGDYLVARCTFNNTVGDRDIHIGKQICPSIEKSKATLI